MSITDAQVERLKTMMAEFREALPKRRKAMAAQILAYLAACLDGV